MLVVGCQVEAESGSATPPVAQITNGEEAASCQFPATVVLLNGSPYCSGTLIHPRFVLTAAHCITIGGMPSTIGFGEDGFAPARNIGVVDCDVHPEYGFGVDVDLAVCELSEAVDDVQPIPVLMGCEHDVIAPDAEVTIVGYGNTQSTFLGGDYVDGVGSGPKRFVNQTIAAVRDEQEEVDLLGLDINSGGCHGDSGGGAYVQLADGSWRVFAVAQSLWNVPGWPQGTGDTGGPPGGSSGAITSGGFIEPAGGFIEPATTTGVAFVDPSEGGPIEVCGYGTTYSLVAPRMDWVEATVGEDVTACFTTDGDWDPNEACTPFPLEIDQSVGSWAMGCAGKVGGEPQCGEIEPSTTTTAGEESSSSDGPEPTSGTESGPGSTSGPDETTTSGPPPATTMTPPGTASADPSTGGSETSGDDAGGNDDDAGCGCRQAGSGGPVSLAACLLGLALFRRRRA